MLGDMSNYPRESFALPSAEQLAQVSDILDSVRELSDEELRALVSASLSSFYTLLNMLIYVRYASGDSELKEQVGEVISGLQQAEERYRQAVGPDYAQN